MQIGEIYYFDVGYTENPSKTKRRPVVILDEIENDILLLISTTSKGRRYPLRGRDRYKIPIQNWRKAGLRKPSWCRGEILIRLPKTDFLSVLSKDDYVGSIPPDDFNEIIRQVERIHG